MQLGQHIWLKVNGCIKMPCLQNFVTMVKLAWKNAVNKNFTSLFVDCFPGPFGPSLSDPVRCNFLQFVDIAGIPPCRDED